MNPDIIKTLTLPESYTIRPTTLDDAEAVGLLWETTSKAIGLHAKSDADDLRSDWQSPKFDLASSSRVVLDANRQIIGYATIWDNSEKPVKPWLDWAVHPEHFEQGIADYLLQWLEQTAQRVIEHCPEGTQIKYESNSSDKAAHRIQFLERMDYTHNRNFYRMLIEMDEAPPEANLAEGIIIRTFNYPDELVALINAEDAIFQDLWGYIQRPLEEELPQWKHRLESDKLFDTSLFFLALDTETNEIVGDCLCRSEQHDNPDNAYVDSLGVVRTYRRKGIALAMLHHAFDEFWRRGQSKVALYVDASSLTGATRLYEKAGMHVDETWMNFSKVIRDGVDYSTTSVEA